MPGLLYAITPAGWPTPRLLNACAQALDAGADWLQYRDKPAPRRDVATALATLCAKRGVPLLINDDPPLAASLGVGVHVGRDDTAVAVARRIVGADALVGASAYGDLNRAQRAQADGASHVAFGRLFESRTKPHAPATHLEVITRARTVLRVPVIGIGGITPDTVAAVIGAGADGVACIDAIFGQDDVAAAVRSLRAAIDSACQPART